MGMPNLRDPQRDPLAIFRARDSRRVPPFRQPETRLHSTPPMRPCVQLVFRLRPHPLEVLLLRLEMGPLSRLTMPALIRPQARRLLRGTVLLLLGRTVPPLLSPLPFRLRHPDLRLPDLRLPCLRLPWPAPRGRIARKAPPSGPPDPPPRLLVQRLKPTLCRPTPRAPCFTRRSQMYLAPHSARFAAT